MDGEEQARPAGHVERRPRAMSGVACQGLARLRRAPFLRRRVRSRCAACFARFPHRAMLHQRRARLRVRSIRSDLFELRRSLMDDWAKFATDASATIVQMRA
jgi:hypothetical protein